MTAREDLIYIVGNDNVSDAPQALDEFCEDISFVHQIKPRLVVKPRNGDDVLKLVQWATTPLVPVSSGPPHSRGDTVPSAGGALIVDLRGMKKIIRIDRKERVAMVGPGVTFGELIPELEKNGLRLNIPLLPRSTKSVVASMLEREPVLMPAYHWDISDPLDCLDIVFGSGDVFRSGAAAGPGTVEEQWATGEAQTQPGGPGQLDLHRLVQGAQGTMGIVRWATLRCEALPSAEEAFLVGSASIDDLFEMVHWLVRLRLVNECLVLKQHQSGGDNG